MRVNTTDGIRPTVSEEETVTSIAPPPTINRGMSRRVFLKGTVTAATSVATKTGASAIASERTSERALESEPPVETVNAEWLAIHRPKLLGLTYPNYEAAYGINIFGTGWNLDEKIFVSKLKSGEGIAVIFNDILWNPESYALQGRSGHFSYSKLNLPYPDRRNCLGWVFDDLHIADKYARCNLPVARVPLSAIQLWNQDEKIVATVWGPGLIGDRASNLNMDVVNTDAEGMEAIINSAFYVSTNVNGIARIPKAIRTEFISENLLAPQHPKPTPRFGQIT